MPSSAPEKPGLARTAANSLFVPDKLREAVTKRSMSEDAECRHLGDESSI
jgi:hypothetical protein